MASVLEGLDEVDCGGLSVVFTHITKARRKCNGDGIDSSQSNC